jgi:hypothetical protein
VLFVDYAYLLQVGVLPVLLSILVHGDKLRRIAVEDLADCTGKLLGTPEGAVGDIDIDRERLVELVIENGAQRGEDTLESLDTATKIEALLAALEEGLLDLGVLLRWPLSHDMVEKVDRVDAVSRPRSLTGEESLEVDEVDLAGPAKVNSVFVATLSGLGRTALLLIEVAVDASVVTVHTLTRPCELVTVPDPEILGLPESFLHCVRVPNLLE